MELERIRLIRDFENDKGTLGRLIYAHAAAPIYTLELPWRNNAQNISRIPAGVYHCGKYPSKKFGLRYHVRDVPERTYILIHAGNFVRDTHGCILLGMNRQYEHGDLKSPCVWSSRVAIEIFERHCDGREFNLEITEDFDVKEERT